MFVSGFAGEWGIRAAVGGGGGEEVNGVVTRMWSGVEWRRREWKGVLSMLIGECGEGVMWWWWWGPHGMEYWKEWVLFLDREGGRFVACGCGESV